MHGDPQDPHRLPLRVVWWAITRRAEAAGGRRAGVREIPESPPPGFDRASPAVAPSRRPGPHGGPARVYARTARREALARDRVATRERDGELVRDPARRGAVGDGRRVPRRARDLHEPHRGRLAPAPPDPAVASSSRSSPSAWRRAPDARSSRAVAHRRRLLLLGMTIAVAISNAALLARARCYNETGHGPSRRRRAEHGLRRAAPRASTSTTRTRCRRSGATLFESEPEAAAAAARRWRGCSSARPRNGDGTAPRRRRRRPAPHPRRPAARRPPTSTRSCSAASPRRWRSSRRSARTATSPRVSTRSAPSRPAIPRSSPSG